MTYPKLTIRGLQVRAVDAPLANPIRTAVGEVPSAPLVLIDISTEEGVTGRSYLFAYTCLLYTSPSPRDGLLSRMPSSA